MIICHSPTRGRLLPLFALVLIFSLPTTGGAESSATEPSTGLRLTVQPLATDRHDFVESLQGGAFHRWVLPAAGDQLRLTVEGVESTAEVAHRDDPSTDILIIPRRLPLDPSTRTLVEDLPVDFAGRTIRLGDQVYRQQGLSLTLRLPTSSTTTWLVVGHTVDDIAQGTDRLLMHVTGVRWDRSSGQFDYRLREHDFSERSGTWQIDADGRVGIAADERDDLNQRRRHYAAKRSISAGPVNLWVPAVHVAEPAAKALVQDLAQAAEVYAAALGLDPLEPVDVVVEEDYPTQGRHLGEIGAARLGPDGRLHIVFHEEDTPRYRFHLARLLMDRAGLKLPYWIDRGAALWLSKDWYGRPFDAWTADLAAAEVLPEATLLLADAPQDDSSTVLWTPIAAALIDRLDGATLGQKLATIPSTERLQRLLGEIAKGPPPPAAPTDRTASTPPPPGADGATADAFRHGVSLAMANGLDIGYHAPALDDQLRRLAALGVDSVSLMPFAYQRQADQPRLKFLNRHPSSETDVGVIHAARRAHAQGFYVLWKPHIWLSHDSWPGDIAMTTEADWRSWFRLYRRYIMHHAVLAQWAGSESFSIGVELGQTVHRDADWRHLIASVRRVYGGRLTYAGNWWDDYDKAEFWDVLDAVGVDAYFPLSDADDADAADLRRGARRAADALRQFARRTSRPILLTEVGFSARPAAWIEPHREGGEVSLEDQRLAYEAFFDTLGKPPWLEGVYIWKVFSHPRGEGAGRPDFRFLGRPAEATIEGYFKRSSPAVAVSTP